MTTNRRDRLRLVRLRKRDRAKRYEYELDSYGNAWDGSGKRRRARGCLCEVPCVHTFRCRSVHHRGKRATPWCRGGDGESCAECWCIEDRRREALKRAA